MPLVDRPGAAGVATSSRLLAAHRESDPALRLRRPAEEREPHRGLRCRPFRPGRPLRLDRRSRRSGRLDRCDRFVGGRDDGPGSFDIGGGDPPGGLLHDVGRGRCRRLGRCRFGSRPARAVDDRFGGRLHRSAAVAAARRSKRPSARSPTGVRRLGLDDGARSRSRASTGSSARSTGSGTSALERSRSKAASSSSRLSPGRNRCSRPEVWLVAFAAGSASSSDAGSAVGASGSGVRFGTYGSATVASSAATSAAAARPGTHRGSDHWCRWKQVPRSEPSRRGSRGRGRRPARPPAGRSPAPAVARTTGSGPRPRSSSSGRCTAGTTCRS